MSPNDRIILNGGLPKLRNKAFASCSFINRIFYYRIQHILIITFVLPLFLFIGFEIKFSVSFLHLKQYVKMYYID